MSGNEFLKENFLILYLHERLILLDDSEIPTQRIEIGCVTCILMRNLLRGTFWNEINVVLDCMENLLLL